MKKSYRELKEADKIDIINHYYNDIKKSFLEISNVLNVSERSISRVLKEANINTKRKNRYTLDESFFGNIDCEEKAYILGLIYADGYVGDEHFNNIVIALNDRDLLEAVAQKLKFTGDIRVSKKGGFENSKEGNVLNFSSEIMANDLRILGLFPNKSLTLNKLPKIAENLYRHFIRGYFDGDGTIVISKKTSYHQVAGVKKKYEYPSLRFGLLGVKEFLESIANIASLELYSIRNTKCEQIKELSVSSKKELKHIYDFLYNDSKIFLKRKYDKWLKVLECL